MAKSNPAKLKKVSVNLPFGIGGAEWEADSTERKAAWAIYVELVTRIAVEDLGEDEGVLREALNSLYALFSITRQILREAGPDVGASRESVGGIAIAVLNKGLRPFLSVWHPALQQWEAQRPLNMSPQEHEKLWPRHHELRTAIKELNLGMKQYAEALAVIIGVTI
jgi:hypothetical protein